MVCWRQIQTDPLLTRCLALVIWWKPAGRLLADGTPCDDLGVPGPNAGCH
jgi:hypothetical protein